MRDLADDLRDYFDALGERMPEPVAQTISTQPRTARWLTAAAVLLIAALVAGGLVLRASDDERRDVRTPIGLDRARIEEGWARQVDAVPEHARVLDLAAGREGLVAVGYRSVPNLATTNGTDPAIWRIGTDGGWTEGALEYVGGPTRVDGVTYWGDAYWASGTGVSGTAVTWRSADGSRWEVVGTTDELRGGGRLIVGATGAGGLVAYGFGGVAHSSDGVTWTRGNIDGLVQAVAHLGDELVALVGPTSANLRTVTVWTSRDGIDWQRVADLGPTADPGATAITEWRGGLWASVFSGGERGRPQLWRSDDARTWTPIETDLPDRSTVDTLVGTVDALVATGIDDASRPAGWVSVDGRTWVPMPDTLERPPGGRLNRAAASGGQVTAASTSELRDTYTWAAPGRVGPVTTPTGAAPLDTDAIGTVGSMPASIIATRGGMIVELDPVSGAVIRTVSPMTGPTWRSLTVAGPSTVVVSDGRNPSGCEPAPSAAGLLQVDVPSGSTEPIPVGADVGGASMVTASPDGTSVASLEGSCLGTPEPAHTLVVRSLVDGTSRRFRLPPRSSDDTRWDVIWIGGWAPDSRRLLIRVQHEPGYEWWVVDTQQDPDEPLSGTVVPPSSDEPPGGYVITPLGTTGRWITPAPIDNVSSYDRLVEVDLTTGRIGEVLYEWPVLTERTQARVVDSDPSGEHLLLVLTEPGSRTNLYRWSRGDAVPVKVADNVTDAAWAR